MKSSALGFSRVLYLILVGIGFFVAAYRSNPDDIGQYSLLVAYSSILTVVLQGGLDRLLLVEVSRVGRLFLQIRARWLRMRLPSLLIAVLITIAFAFFGASYAIAGGLLLTRLLLNDLEAMALARGRTTSVTIGTMLNGIATGCGLALVAPGGEVSMLAVSCIGNILALLLVTTTALGKAIDAPEGQFCLAWNQAVPFGLMTVFAVIYQRADLAIVGATGVGAAAVGTYAISLRAVETLVAFRGALVQRLAVAWSAMSDGEVDLAFTRLINRATVLAGGTGAIIMISANLLDRSGLLQQYAGLWGLVSIVGLGTPLIASHLLTSAWVYSRAGSIRRTMESAGLAAAACLLTFLCVFWAGVEGAMAATVLMEFVSYLVFLTAFRKNAAQVGWPARYILPWLLVTLILVCLFLVLRGGTL